MSKHQKVRTSRMQQAIRELLKEEGLYSDSDDSNKGEEDKEVKASGRRGRKAIPEKWTKVISVKSDDLSSNRTYELASELLLDSSFGTSESSKGQASIWKPVFWPPHFKKEHKDFSLDGNVQPDADLIKLGEKISAYRSKLKQDACKALQDENLDEEILSDLQAKKLAKWMHRSNFSVTSKLISTKYDGQQEVPVLLRKRSRTKSVIIPEEKLDIVYEAVIKLKKHAEIAK